MDSDRMQEILSQDGEKNIELLRKSGKYGLAPSDLRFANSMIEQLDRTMGLSTKQWHWVNKLAERCTKAIADYGHRTGRCRFCRRLLKDPLSVKLGYGPICARKHNLPH